MTARDGPPLEDAGRADRAAIAALSERVAELERQVAFLRQQEPVATLSAAAPPPPLPAQESAGAAVVQAASASDGGAIAADTKRARSRSDLENRIGSQIFNRVGIVALLLAAAWFLKLAIASGWIGPMGRVLVGLAAGAGLVVWSERFRRKGFAVFSYSLKAVGSSVLYLALWAAFQLYHLLPAPVALLAMTLVTAWNGYMAWAQDAELLGGYALAGAVAVPKLLATGGDHEVFLFTYLLAVDLLCVLLVRLKGWVRLLPWVFVSTVVYFFGWDSGYFAAPALLLTMIFVVLFFAVFLVPVFVTVPVTEAEADAVTPFVRTSTGRSGRRWRSLTTVLLPLADAAFVALALYSVLQDAGHHASLPWLMVLLAALYLGLMRLPQPAVTAGVHLSLAVVFLTIAIPLKATGEWITISWLVEGVALLSLGLLRAEPRHEEQGRLLRLLACAALLLGWSGAMTRVLLWGASGSRAFVNARFGTALAGLVAMAAAILLSRRVELASGTRPWRELQGIAAGAVIAFNVLAISASIREISAVWSGALAPDPEAVFKRSLAISAFLMIYGAALLAAGFRRRSAFVRWQGLVLVTVTIAKIFLWDTRNLGQGYRIASFLGLGVLLMAISFVYQRDLLSLRGHEAESARKDGPA